MSVGQAIRDAAAQMAATSDTARLDAELLMAHALGVSRSDMLIRHMDAAVLADFSGYVARRIAREPVAYITGVQEFYGRQFAVSSEVLIPRADSETLIEAALECAAGARSVLDLGTGSGALLVTALLELDGPTGVGIDASAKAVEITKANTAALGIAESRVRILQRSWRNDRWAEGLGIFDLILCNPPYVEADAPLEPDVRDYEPHAALFAGPEGLDDYRVLIPQLRALMTPQAVAILEIGATQAGPVTELAEKSGFQVSLRHDLANRPRALILS